MKKQILNIFSITLISIALIWLVGGNLYNQHKKQAIDQYWKHFFNTKLKIVKTNQSALTLGKYAHYLNIEYDDIQEITPYLNNELKKEKVTSINYPPKVNQVLIDIDPELKALRRSLLMSESPQWDSEIYLNMNFETRSPSYLSIANFTKILALDSLDKIRLNQTETVLENLELTWKIKESVRQQPLLISQLVAIIIDSYLIGILRQVDYAPSIWQTRLNQLLSQDYYNSFLMGLELEIFSTYNSLSNLLTVNYNIFTKYPYRIKEKADQLNQNRLKEDIDLFHKPYLTFSAIDFHEKKHLFLQSIPNKNFCNLDPISFQKQYLKPLASWNLMKNVDDSLSIRSWLKLFHRLIDWELTLKILQVKELAIKQGKWPEKVPGIETSICEDRQWIYQVSADGKTMSISYSQPPVWWDKERMVDYPLTYSSQRVPRLNP